MAYNHKTGGIWIAPGDACHCYKYGNGEVIAVDKQEVIVLFEWWTGTLDNKTTHRHLTTLDPTVFQDKLKERSGVYWWGLRSDDIPKY